MIEVWREATLGEQYVSNFLPQITTGKNLSFFLLHVMYVRVEYECMYVSISHFHSLSFTYTRSSRKCHGSIMLPYRIFLHIATSWNAKSFNSSSFRSTSTKWRKFLTTDLYWCAARGLFTATTRHYVRHKRGIHIMLQTSTIPYTRYLGHIKSKLKSLKHYLCVSASHPAPSMRFVPKFKLFLTFEPAWPNKLLAHLSTVLPSDEIQRDRHSPLVHAQTHCDQQLDLLSIISVTFLLLWLQLYIGFFKSMVFEKYCFSQLMVLECGSFVSLGFTRQRNLELRNVQKYLVTFHSHDFLNSSVGEPTVTLLTRSTEQMSSWRNLLLTC